MGGGFKQIYIYDAEKKIFQQKIYQNDKMNLL